MYFYALISQYGDTIDLFDTESEAHDYRRKFHPTAKVSQVRL